MHNVLMAKTQQRKLEAHEVNRIATIASVDPRTVLKFSAGEKVRPLAAERIRRALAAAGLAALCLLVGCMDGTGNAPTVPDAGSLTVASQQDAQALQTPDSGPAVAPPDVVPDAMPRDSYVVPVAPDAGTPDVLPATPDARIPDAYVVPGLPTAQQVSDAKPDTVPSGIWPGVCPDVVVSIGIQTVLLANGTWGTEPGWTVTNRTNGTVGVALSTLPYDEYLGSRGCPGSALGPTPGGGIATIPRGCIPVGVTTLVMRITCMQKDSYANGKVETRNYPVGP